MRTLDTIPNCLCTYGSRWLTGSTPVVVCLCVEQTSLLPTWMKMTELGWPLDILPAGMSAWLVSIFNLDSRGPANQTISNHLMGTVGSVDSMYLIY